jgi:hypothetical protein
MKGISMRFLFITGLLLFTACKKAENRSCWKGSGEKVTKVISLPSFQSMELHQRLQIELVQDSLEFLEVQAGENLQNFIDWSVVDGKLEIWNHNKCPYLRYKTGDVKVIIHFKTLSKLIYWGSELLISSDTIQADYLDVLMNDGAGDLDLAIHANALNVVNPHGFSSISVRGWCKFLRLDIDGYGTFDTRDLTVNDSIAVMYASNGTSFLDADHIKIKAELSSSGNVMYQGIPTLIQKSRYGTGDLIHQ